MKIDYKETRRGYAPDMIDYSGKPNEVLNLLMEKVAIYCPDWGYELFNIWDWPLKRTFQQGGECLVAIHTAGVSDELEFVERGEDWDWKHVYIVRVIVFAYDDKTVELYEIDPESVVIKKGKED